MLFICCNGPLTDLYRFPFYVQDCALHIHGWFAFAIKREAEEVDKHAVIWNDKDATKNISVDQEYKYRENHTSIYLHVAEKFDVDSYGPKRQMRQHHVRTPPFKFGGLVEYGISWSSHCICSKLLLHCSRWLIDWHKLSVICHSCDGQPALLPATKAATEPTKAAFIQPLMGELGLRGWMRPYGVFELDIFCQTPPYMTSSWGSSQSVESTCDFAKALICGAEKCAEPHWTPLTLAAVKSTALKTIEAAERAADASAAASVPGEFGVILYSARGVSISSGRWPSERAESPLHFTRWSKGNFPERCPSKNKIALPRASL
ncbi:hypothetical protein SADUNF_Sadunf01G0077300 [Salix dunnii]|uniref:Uncharacterized protein n=1 Tax=Salix dunnii TaxID=1413687 RepID=A0A835TJH2_9ROSI|nr:hypothetical protein SADUNF_Sadunf01G0077300 [Salix dunnii]